MPGKSGVRPAGALPSSARIVARGVPDVAIGVGGHGEVLQAPHCGNEPAESRAGGGRAVFRKTAVMLVVGVEVLWILAWAGGSIRHGRACRTSRRTMV